MQVEYTPKQIARFWRYVEKSDTCWTWTGYCGPKGYGCHFLTHTFNAKGKRVPVSITAHRFSYTLHYGEIPPKMSVCHKCDNPPCVRPDHLWLGTNGDNVRDMYAKGRGGNYKKGSPGESHPHSKLTEAQVYAMRAEYRKLVNGLSKKHSVTPQLIRLIFQGKAWAHLGNPGSVSSAQKQDPMSTLEPVADHGIQGVFSSLVR